MEETLFEGGVFSKSLDDGRAGAEVELAHDGVVAVTPDGRRFRIPYAECQIEIGGFNGRMVFCRNADRSLTIFCESGKFPRALAWAAGGLLDDQLQAQRSERSARSWRGRGAVIATLVGGALLIAGLYFGVRAAGTAAVRAVPVAVDREIGNQAFLSLDPGGPEVTDPVVIGAMQSIVDRLKPHAAIAGLDFELHVVDAPVFNAYALPGGKITIYTGLIQQADNPEQVAGVLAHEMAHATLRHGIQRISQSIGLAVAVNLLLGDVQGLVVAGAQLFQLASINSYSRDQESEADAEGVRMMHAAGIDPRGLSQFFETLKEQGADLPAGLSWISTHPEHEARIITVRDTLATLPEREFEPLDIDWADVQRRITE